MAWRIHENVRRGEIDNRTRRRVTGRIWLEGMAEPIVLELAGDCQPDLAGCLLRFENPHPIAMTTPPPAPRQRGAAGHITAARKVRVFDVPLEEVFAMHRAGETPPEHLASSIYLEWFSDLSGHVVIESADYRLEISEPAWRFSAEELRERKRLATEAGAAPFAIEIHADGTEERWDEFRCEQFLRENDARTDRYGKLLEKYRDHPDSERLIAREMGWSWLEEALDAEAAGDYDDARAEDAAAFDEAENLEEPAPDPAREGIDWVREGDGDLVHPLQKQAHDALYELTDELQAAGHFPDCSDDDLGNFVGLRMTICAKLAGALNGIARGEWEPDPGMTIARLKRILAILHEALAAGDRLAGKPFLAAERLAYHRAALFTTREHILALIARLREA